MKTAIVTGATKGIGRASAVALSEAGWWVLATGRDEREGKALQAEISRAAGGAFVGIDLTEDGGVQAIVSRAVSDTGRVDLLVNNAGILSSGGVADVEPDGYDRVMAINLRAPVLLSKAVLAVMLQQGTGVIVNVSSEVGLVAGREQVAYNISKAGLVMLTKSITADYASRGIRAVTICPGTTWTPMVEQALASEPSSGWTREKLAAIRPANRLGTPEEIAAAIVFVANDQVSYLNGSELVIDGGYTAV